MAATWAGGFIGGQLLALDFDFGNAYLLQCAQTSASKRKEVPIV